VARPRPQSQHDVGTFRFMAIAASETPYRYIPVSALRRKTE